MAGFGALVKPYSQAATDLGLGDMLQSQQKDETEEKKKRRMMGLSPLAQTSPAVQQLFGLGNVRGRGY